MNLLRALLFEQREDRFSIALAALLDDRQVRNAFLTATVGWDLALESEEPWRLATQVLIKGGRADVVLESPRRTLIVEAKLSAPFGEGQPHNYAQYLRALRATESREVALVLLAPSGQLPTYRETARQRLAENGCADLLLGSMTWEAVGELCGGLADRTTGELRLYLQAFADLVSDYFGHMPRPLTEGEVLALGNTETRYGISEALELIDPIVTELSRLLPELQVANRATGNFFIGRYLTWRSCGYWIGFWTEPWILYGEGPLWIQMDGRRPWLPPALREALRVREHLESLIAPLPLLANMTREQQAVVLARTVEQFLRSEFEAV